MSKVTVLANQKGGVGKTTTTVNLGVGLAAQGNKALTLCPATLNCQPLRFPSSTPFRSCYWAGVS